MTLHYCFFFFGSTINQNKLGKIKGEDEKKKDCCPKDKGK